MVTDAGLWNGLDMVGPFIGFGSFNLGRQTAASCHGCDFREWVKIKEIDWMNCVDSVLLFSAGGLVKGISEPYLLGI